MLRLREQQTLNEEQIQYLEGLGLLDFEVKQNDFQPTLGIVGGQCSYYVGAVWLKKDHPLVVYPKVDDIDFLRILSDAISYDIKQSYFEESYHIRFDEPYIEDNALNSVLSPLIVAHFLSIMKKLLSKGLKKNYIIREENLKNKVKGHILTLRTLQKNILNGHAERNYCRFQEYSVDYPENRLLKRALLASESMIKALKRDDNGFLLVIQKCLSYFNDVSKEISLSEVKTIRFDKLRGEYPEAIKIAKMILKRTDFSITLNADSLDKVPVFCIDMSRIFEFYVLGILQKQYNDVEFQFNAGSMGRCDYLIPSEKLIVDAKYKEKFNERDTANIRADIREVVGYSRSAKVQNKLHVNSQESIPCLIIYPQGYSSEEFVLNGSILENAVELRKDITDFYCLGIPVPRINRN